MAEVNDGGPAYPYRCCEGPGQDKTYHFAPGMSLRDWFAGMALQGLLSGDAHPDVDPMSILNSPEKRAKCAYMLADAMLAARQPQPDQEQPE